MNGGKWHKVKYNANRWERLMYRTGTCTSASSYPPHLVRARGRFLIDHPELLPEYDVIAANCECVAAWCKTGSWATFQAIDWLPTPTAGQALSAVYTASTVAGISVVPTAGIWGWMGYTTTTTVPLIATQPYLLPAITIIWILHEKYQAKRATELLNKSFWKAVIDQPDVFVECIINGRT